MKLLRYLLLSLLFLSALGQLPSQDILALLEFKKGIKHDPTGFVLQSWNDESIDFNGCPSSWNGIVCNGGNVAGVVLDNLDLSADADLRMGKLGSLRNLSLAGNNFSGPLPDSISGLASIQSLDLSRNSLSGSIPVSFTRMDSLVYLDLSSNGFSKKIPRGFELISGLQMLDLHGNMLDGHLDGEFFLLTNASHVDFSGNLLGSSNSGKLLPGISDSVKYLNLSRNQLTGSLLSGGELRLFSSLKVLDLSYNQLSGGLPGFDYAYELQVLKLGNNMFSGFVPNDLLKGDSLLLSELDLSANNLSGPITAIMSTTLHILNLSSNGLKGELPLLTGGCAVLDLSGNQFHGNLSRILKWGDVEYLDLSQNRLIGPLPEAAPQLMRLNYLNLSYNSLTGSLPRAITQYPKMRVLDLSSNQLKGPLLSDLLTLPTLQQLHLSHNSLTGAIEYAPPNSKSDLQVLDLSHNLLDGYFPDRFGSLAGLEELNLAGNNISGSLPTSMAGMSSLSLLDLSQNFFTGPIPSNLSSSLQRFNVSNNDLSGVVPENLRTFSTSSFYPGNSKLIFPGGAPGSSNAPAGNSRKPINTAVKIVVIVSCVIAVIILIMLAIFIHYLRLSSRSSSDQVANKAISSHPMSKVSGGGSGTGRGGGGALVVSAEDLVAARKGSSSEILSPDEKLAAVTGGFSPSKHSRYSWSPESGGESLPTESLARLDVRSPDRLVGELHFLDDAISLTPEELSRAPAEVLGRSSHGTSYRATLDNGVFLTVKWLREGVAKPKKDFAKEARKFANIRHPNVVGLRGYYWGPTQHEKLILSDYISPGSLASFLFDRPGRRGPPLTWVQRLKIAVDVARSLNYLHFDRAVPHGNLKATNILLDGPELNARVSDYCLHRLMTQAGTVVQILDAGVLGYRAPELAASKKPVPSFKSDVYAFGVILLEILTGRCAGDVITGEEGAVDLTDWIRLRVAEGRGTECIDAAMVQEVGNPGVEKGMKEVLGIALRCIRSVSERPGIKTIYEDLSSI
ncbi:LRR receptor-like serine/threonine-protein kinase GHR1 [Linum perenne]